jgi:hypothetical protein
MAAEGPLAEEVQALAGKVDRAVKASSARARQHGNTSLLNIQADQGDGCC